MHCRPRGEGERSTKGREGMVGGTQEKCKEGDYKRERSRRRKRRELHAEG